MNNYEKIFNRFGIKVPRIMLPAESTAMEKWAVIACDQYTSQPEYWSRASELTAGEPSTLNLIFPECYLEDSDADKRIESINSTMKDYVDNSVLSEPVEGFILLKRDTPKTKNRWGLMTALDLEEYDFSKGSKSQIRATEGTILDRIPPRVRIRENALLELPHIMVLLDDPEKSIIEPLIESRDSLEKLYDFNLMMDSGSLEAYRVNSTEQLNKLGEAVEKLGNPEKLKNRYNSEGAFLFAMGDGNHSLATAKTIWENYKKEHASEPDLMNHPSRWALVELVNIYSEGIEFEAIHRALFDIDSNEFMNALSSTGEFRLTEAVNLDEMIKKVDNSGGRQICGYCHDKGFGLIEALKPTSSIIAGTIQNFIDNYLKTHGGSVDYIHGVDVTDELGRKPGNLSIFLPAILKETFFQTVIDDGAFPRKTFSMGESFEKRFYVETRFIK